MSLSAPGPAFPLSAPDLARWSKFALKGGIGTATATTDVEAEDEEADLMMLEGDEIVVLLDLNDSNGNFLGFCEGVVGRFNGDCVQFTSRLKRPVLLPRSNNLPIPPPSSPSSLSPLSATSIHSENGAQLQNAHEEAARRSKSLDVAMHDASATKAHGGLSAGEREQLGSLRADSLPLERSGRDNVGVGGDDGGFETELPVPQQCTNKASRVISPEPSTSKRPRPTTIFPRSRSPTCTPPQSSHPSSNSPSSLLSSSSSTSSSSTTSPSLIHHSPRSDWSYKEVDEALTPELPYTDSPPPINNKGSRGSPVLPPYEMRRTLSQSPPPISHIEEPETEPPSEHNAPRSETPLSLVSSYDTRSETPNSILSTDSNPNPNSNNLPNQPRSKFSDASTIASSSHQSHQHQPQLQSKFSSDSSSAFSYPPLHSKFSDASLASSRYKIKLSDGPSLLDYASQPQSQLPYSQFSPASTATRRLPTLSEQESSPSSGRTRGAKSSDESTWSAAGTGDVENPSVPGEETELFGAIFDSYRYSRTDSESRGSPAPESLNDSPVSQRRLRTNSQPGRLGGSEPEPGVRRVRTTSQGVLGVGGEGGGKEEEEIECPSTPMRYGAASALRSQLGRQGTGGPSTGTTPTSRPLLPTSESVDSIIGASIPRLRDLFPRSSTTDSFGSLSDLLSDSPSTPPRVPPKTNSTPPPPKKNGSDKNEEGVPVPRRLFQTYFSPPRDQQPRSKTILGLPDTPSPPRSKRKAGAKGLLIGSPVSLPGSAWRSGELSPTRYGGEEDEDDLFLSPAAKSNNSSSGPGTPTTTLTFPPELSDAFPIPPNSTTLAPPFVFPSPSSSYSTTTKSNHHAEPSKQPSLSPIQARAPKLTSASIDPPEHAFEELPRHPPQPPSTPTFTAAFASSSSPSSGHSNNSATIPPTMTRDGPARSRSRPNLRVKTSQNEDEKIIVPPRTADDRVGERNSLTHKSSGTGSLFQFTRKRSNTTIGSGVAESRTPASYGAPVSSKDFESERVHVQNADFDMVKPLAEMLLREDEAREARETPTSTSGTRPSFSSTRTGGGGRPSMASRRPTSEDLFDVDEEGSEDDSRTHGGAFSPTLGGSFGSKSTTSFANLKAELDSKTVELHRVREGLWLKTMASGGSVKRNKKMLGLVQGGVPSSVRGKVWSWLAEAEAGKVGGVYAELSEKGPHSWREAIASDVKASFQDDPQFEVGSTSRDDLELVLNALTRYDAELGYIKGLAFTAGIILTHVPAEVSTTALFLDIIVTYGRTLVYQETFWCLVALIKRYGFRNYFSCGFESLILEVRVFDIILEGADPKLAEHLREHNAGPEAFLPSWVSTLFATVLPYETRLRCIDLFFYEPKLAIRVALAILELSRTQILACQSRGAILELFKGLPHDETLGTPAFMPTLLTTKLRDDKIKQARKKAEASFIKAGKA
ncbi:hypothetical protein P7C70_g7283, partial [Phenoliferia sp. Uapishka_3]